MKSNGSTEDAAFIGGARIYPEGANETDTITQLRRDLEARRSSTTDLELLDETSDLRDLYTKLGTDERRLLLDLSRKLSGKGKREYGQLCIATDMRNPCREAAEELTDAIAYTQMLATGWADYIDALREENARLRQEVERLRHPEKRVDPLGKRNDE